MDKKLKIVMIYPLSRINRLWWNCVPEGMARLSAYLKQKGFDVKQINLNVKCLYYNLTNDDKIETDILSWENVDNYLRKGDIGSINQTIEKMLDLCALDLDCTDLVCFSVIHYHQFCSALCLAKKIKETTKAKIIFGGAFVSSHVNYRDLFNNYNFIDFIVQGPGEISLSVLAEMLSKGKVNEKEVPGLVYREEKHIRTNPAKICKLDNLPTPDFGDSINYYLQIYKKLKRDKYNPDNLIDRETYLYYQISRGCIHKCNFCDSALSEKIEFRSPEKIVSDLKEIVLKYGVRRFYFGCNTFNMSKKHVTNLCEAIISSNLDIKWVCFARPAKLDYKALSLMKQAGCENLMFGVETGSQRLLDYLNKDISIEEMEQTLKNTKKAGISTTINLILNIPTETGLDIKKTASFIKRNTESIDVVAIHRFFYLTKTSFYQADNSVDQNSVYLKPPRNVNEIKELFDMAKKIKTIVMLAHTGTFFDDDYSDAF